MKKILTTLVAALLTFAGGAAAQTAFPLFQPSDGIMVGDQNTYVTTSATGADVISLFSGTCNGAAFLRGDASCFDLFGSSNTWTSGQTFTLARTNAVAPLLMSASSTAARWRETDAPANNQQWEWAANAEQFRLGALDDSGVLGGSSTAFLVDRTGNVVDGHSFGGWQRALSNGSTGLPAYAFANDIDAGMFLNAVGDLRIAIGGNDKIAFASSGVLTPNIQLQMLTNPLIINVDPILWFWESDAPADNRMWNMRANSEQLTFQAYNDAISSAGTWLAVQRTGTVVDSITFDASDITLDASNITLDASTGVTLTANTTITKADTRLCMYDSGQDATWFWRASTTDLFRLYVVDGSGCTTTGAAIPLAITAAAGVTSNININATDLEWNNLDMVNVGSSPTWTGTHAFTNDSANLRFNGNNPRMLINETDAGVDAKNWLVRAVAGQFAISTANDASPFSAVSDPFVMARSGTTATTLTYSGTGAIIHTGNGHFVGSADAPRFALNETDAAADNRLWRLGTSAETLVWGTRNDLDNAGVEFFSVDRSGTAISSVAFPSVAPVITGASSVEGVGTLSTAPKIQALSTNAAPGISGARYSADSSPFYLVLGKSRGAAIGTNTILQAGDEIGRFEYAGADGTDLLTPAADIRVEVDGAPGANDMPGRIVFRTTADGANSTTERLRISNAGALGLAGANFGVSGQVLTSNGSGSPPSWQNGAGSGILLAVKTADTARNTTTSPTDDPHLTMSLASGVTYVVEAYLPWGCASANTGGMRARINFTGTSTFRFSNSMDSFAGSLQQLGAGDSAWDDANTAGTSTCTTTIGGQWRKMEGTIATTSTGTLSVRWAQQVSNGANVTVRTGSYLRATRQ